MKNNILVLSFEAFTKEGSNGKTLWSMLENVQNEFNISQIYIKGCNPNVEAKCRFLKINEQNIKHLLIKKTNVCKNVFSKQENENVDCKTVSSNIKKNSATMLIRNCLWHLLYLKFKYVYEWIDKEKPDYLILMDSDLAFFDYFALKIKKKYKCKIIFYTTENYCLKEKNYMNGLFTKDLMFKIFRNKLFNSHKKLFKFTSCEIFLTESLKKDYLENFNIFNPLVIYPSANCDKLPKKNLNDIMVFSYCGSLKVGRFKTLIKFLETIKNYKNIKIFIASNITEDQKKELGLYKAVTYFGYLDYKKVVNIYKKSDLLLHFESFDKNIADDCKHAFSGKIADCISTCKPFLYFGPNTNSICSFIDDNKCGFSITNESKLINTIELFNKDQNYMHLYDLNEEITANKFFNKANNEKTIKKLFLSLN